MTGGASLSHSASLSISLSIYSLSLQPRRRRRMIMVVVVVVLVGMVTRGSNRKEGSTGRRRSGGIVGGMEWLGPSPGTRLSFGVPVLLSSVWMIPNMGLLCMCGV